MKDALLCEAFGADALGFIFYKKSKRYINPDKAKEIIFKLSPFTLKVGVFVDESSDAINKIIRYANLNAAQLHGNETQEFINSINIPVIKSFRISDEFDFSELSNYENCNFLFDSFSNKLHGGTGKKFNWDLIPNELKNKIILSGGISSNNIEHIVQRVKPFAIDISSSLENAPGKKNSTKVKEFFTTLNKLRKE